MIVDWNPILLHLGPVSIRWYGFLMAFSILVGFYYLRRGALRAGYSEDFIYNLVFLSVVGGIIGARFIYVVTNWADFSGQPLQMLRIDEGGLSFHGGILGGFICGGGYLRLKGASFRELADLAVPGIALGIVLVRIGNLFNQEVLGRPAEIMAAFGLMRHPAQLYGSAIGVVLLVLHNVLARRKPPLPPGYLWWSFFMWYGILRGVVEETFRDNPLYALGYVNGHWGIGFFTLTQLVTPVLVALGWSMRRRTLKPLTPAKGPKQPKPARP
ncbi:MAG TPA: prolipoprotein diacylglyceryl transferase [Limnochordia bacterium]|nr:prolipoprotein diacylglyceryl transferase [Limnochordia bacterium]